LKNTAVVLVANHQPAEVLEPGDGAFNLPAAAVTPQLAAILRGRSSAPAAVRADQVPALGQQVAPQFVTVIGPVGDQRRGPVARRDFLEGFFRKRDLCRRSRRGKACERNSLTIRHHHQLRTLSAFGFSDPVAPFFAGVNVPSTNTSSQSTSPRSSSVSRKACHIFSSTPSASHSESRRQQVLGDGNRSGKSRHRAPLRSTQRMPSKQARSSAGGRPPFGRGLRRGNRGSILSHCSSVSSKSFRLAIEELPSMALIPEVLTGRKFTSTRF